MTNKLAFLAPGASDEDVAAFVAYLRDEEDSDAPDADDESDDKD